MTNIKGGLCTLQAVVPKCTAPDIVGETGIRWRSNNTVAKFLASD